MNMKSTGFGVLCSGVFLVAGCGGDQAPVGFQETLSRAQALEDSHYAAVMAMEGAEAMQNETQRYAGDMGRTLDEMRSECSGMRHERSMMGSGDPMGDMEEMIDSAMAMVGTHHERMASMEDPEEMRRECEEHHASMEEAFGEMHDALDGGGMSEARHP